MSSLNVFIATAASSVGIDNLDPALCAALGPDIEYRLREIVQELALLGLWRSALQEKPS